MGSENLTHHASLVTADYIGGMGKKQRKTEVVEAADDQPLDLDMDCRGCGSTDHTEYADVRSETIDDQVITWRRTMCLHCGQHRINRFGRAVE